MSFDHTKPITFDAAARLCRGLIRHHARRIRPTDGDGSGCSRDDLEQAGLIAVWKAWRTFDGRSAFDTYASFLIRQGMIDELRRATGVRRTGRPPRPVPTPVAELGHLPARPDPEPTTREEFVGKLRRLAMNETQVQAFALTLFDDLTGKQVADLLGLSRFGTWDATHAARKRIAEQFSREDVVRLLEVA